MFKLMGKKIIAILHYFFLLYWPYVSLQKFSFFLMQDIETHTGEAAIENVNTTDEGR